MKISIRIDSAAAQAQLRRWGGEFRDKVKKAVAKAMAKEAVEIKTDVRDQVASQLTVVKKTFLKGFSAYVIDKDPSRLPALYVGSRIPWVGMHEKGGTISAKMLIPLHGRVGRKRFKAQIAELMRGGNAYFIKNAKGNVVLISRLPYWCPASCSKSDSISSDWWCGASHDWQQASNNKSARSANSQISPQILN